MDEFKKPTPHSRDSSFDKAHAYAQLILRQRCLHKGYSSVKRISKPVSPFPEELNRASTRKALQNQIQQLSERIRTHHSNRRHRHPSNESTENSNLKRARSGERKQRSDKLVCKRHQRKQLASLGLTATFEKFVKGKESLIKLITASFKTKGLPPPTTIGFYKVGKCLGRGAFGKVYLGIHKLTGLKVGIKVIDKTAVADERTRRKVMNEVLMMKRVVHSNVVRLLEMFESNHHLVIVQEYAGGGDLLSFMKTRGKLPENEAKELFLQIAEGLKACHSHRVVHRDVKLDNVLLNTDLTMAKLCDFGVSRLAIPGEKVTEVCGTPAYLAPEIIANTRYDPFYVDLWSLGVLLYALLCGTVPFKAKTLPELNKLILRGKYELPPDLTEEVKNLLRRLLNPVPQLRITLEELDDHPWLSSRTADSVDDSILPRFCGESDSIHQNTDESKLLGVMQTLGFPKEYVLRSLQFNDLNHATATYHLLAMYSRRTKINSNS